MKALYFFTGSVQLFFVFFFLNEGHRIRLNSLVTVGEGKKSKTFSWHPVKSMLKPLDRCQKMESVVTCYKFHRTCIKSKSRTARFNSKDEIFIIINMHVKDIFSPPLLLIYFHRPSFSEYYVDHLQHLHIWLKCKLWLLCQYCGSV